MRTRAGATAAAVLVAMAMASTARAADGVWWTNSNAGGISWAAADATSAGNLAVPGTVLPTSIHGLAIDAAAGRAYFVTPNDGKLRYAKLDGSGGGEIPTPGISIDDAHGLAIDPLGGRAYIADARAGRILFAKLDGSGGGQVTTTGAPVSAPWAIAVDPAGGRVYWGSSTQGANGKIAFANLDGSGGGTINTTGATELGTPYGIAVDPAAGRVYWSNALGKKISFARLDGGGGSDLNTTGASAIGPRGLAVDAEAGRIYWADSGTDRIAYARLDNTGGANLSTLSATVASPWGVNVLKAPRGTGAPTVSSAAPTGPLTCSDGTWAPDVPGSFFFRAPQTFAYAWTRDGQPVSGATAKTLSPTAAGAYVCTVTATNRAGATPQSSPPFTVAETPPPSAPGASPTAPPVRASIRITQITNKRVITFTTTVAGRVRITAGTKTSPITRTFGAGSHKVRFVLRPKAVATLNANRRLSVILTAKLTPSGGGKPVTVFKSVLLTRKGG